jgi:hypothetical protein
MADLIEELIDLVAEDAEALGLRSAEIEGAAATSSRAAPAPTASAPCYAEARRPAIDRKPTP